jgi:hypothetical protein
MNMRFDITLQFCNNHSKLSWFFCKEPGFAGVLPVSTVILRGSAGIYRGSVSIHRCSTVALPAISYPGKSPVVPGRAKDEAGKAILPGSFRTTPVILNILFHPGSNAGCSRIIPDVVGRVTDVPRLFPVVPRSYPDHPGRLPGLCRDVSVTVALKSNLLRRKL